MKQHFLIIFCLVAGFSAFGKQHRSGAQKGKTINAISLYRTGCYGKCPSYKIEVEKSGAATYRAIMFNEDSGVFVKKLNKKQVKSILGQAASARIDTCKDDYTAPATDLPGMILTLNYSGSIKTINNANYGPAVLQQLAKTLDGLVGKKADQTWRKL